MIFSEIALQDQLSSMIAALTDPWRRAQGDNYFLESRVTDALRVDFEQRALLIDGVPLDAAHIEYFQEFVRNAPIPATLNRAFSPDEMRDIEGSQMLVRVEDISWALADGSGIQFDELRDALPDGGARDDDLVDQFLGWWNARRYSNPHFATFHDLVREDCEHADWPHRLRNRLGLAHLDPKNAPIHVALMGYSVDVIRKAAPDKSIAIGVPTVFDSQPWPYFFPSPVECCYGRAMGLGTDHGEDGLQVEIIHFRPTYRRQHLLKVGTITQPIPDIGLKELRNHHLLCLRLASGIHDYGSEW